MTADTNYTIEDLTTGAVNGSGIFDKIMTTLDAHLLKQFKEGRITGDAYAKAYTATVNTALGQGISFLLTKDKAAQDVVLAGEQVSQVKQQTALIKEQTTKTTVETENLQVAKATAQYQLDNLLPLEVQQSTKNIERTQEEIANLIVNKNTSQYQLDEVLPLEVQRSTEEIATIVINKNTAQYNLDNILPQELAQSIKNVERTTADIAGVTANTAISAYQLSDLLPLEKATTQFNLDTILPKQASQLDSEIAILDLNKDTAQYQLDNLLPVELAKGNVEVVQLTATKDTALYQLNNILPKQRDLICEQIEAQRGQTLGTRSDGTVISGSVGKQVELYEQQINSYQRDSEFKVAKMYLDAWITQKTLDEGLIAPPELTNVNIDDVLSTFRANNNL